MGKLTAAAIRANPILAPGKNGKPEQTIEAFISIMKDDLFFDNIRYDELRGCGEVNNKGEIHAWNDTDDAACMYYLESTYGLYSKERYQAALRLLFRERTYHPLQDIINKIQWDGKERCAEFLCKWGLCDDSPYVREVSRLIFAGGINRLYNPGCKFEDVPIFMGHQGCGKSTLTRWLAIDDDYHGDLKLMEGQQAIEDLQGKWIMEIQEMSAFTKAKDQEVVKAFISRQRDRYRKPYDRNVTELPRRCIFVSTSNDLNPLIDKTGNRRWYPVEFHGDRSWSFHLFRIESEVRAYIAQCWAEARERRREEFMRPFASFELLPDIQTAQDAAMQDDWRVGAVMSFLDRKSPGELTCVRELFHRALSSNPDFPHEPTLVESKDMAKVLDQLEDWERVTGTRSVGLYGKQRCWRKKVKSQTTELVTEEQNAPTQAAEDDYFWEESDV